MMNLIADITIDDEKWHEADFDVDDLARATITKTILTANKKQFHKEAEISLVLTNNREIKKLNQMYRGKNKATNVLSFPLIDFTSGEREDPQGHALGDIVLALETVQKEAAEQNKPFAHHVMHLLTHGTLHLLGYDHEDDTDADKMENLEIKILDELGVKNPYGPEFFVA